MGYSKAGDKDNDTISMLDTTLEAERGVECAQAGGVALARTRSATRP